MKDNFGAIAVVTLAVAILGVIVPILWDYYSGQKGITLTLMSHNEVISSSTAVEGLEINYKGTKLPSLSRMTFLIENTGNKPIVESDVVSPIKIETLNKSNILDVIVDSKTPNNLDLQAMKNSQSVVIKFTLLNPGDKAFVSLLVDSNEEGFAATSRIAGVQDLNVNHTPPKTLTIWVLLWIPVSIFSLALLLASSIGFIQYPQELRVKEDIRNGRFEIPDFKSYEEARKWIKKTINFLTSGEAAPIFDVLAEQEEKNSEFNRELISNVINKSVLRSMSNLKMALVVSSIGLFGLYYALSSLGDL